MSAGNPIQVDKGRLGKSEQGPIHIATPWRRPCILYAAGLGASEGPPALLSRVPRLNIPFLHVLIIRVLSLHILPLRKAASLQYSNSFSCILLLRCIVLLRILLRSPLRSLLPVHLLLSYTVLVPRPR